MAKLFATSQVRYCRPCEKEVVARPRVRFAGVGIVLAVGLTLALISFSALIGPFIMFTLPLILVAGFAIGPLVSLATAPETCPACARELPFASRIEAKHHGHAQERALGPTAQPHPRAASDMKAA